MRYITYGTMGPFYTISELCELFGVTKDFLKKKGLIGQILILMV